MTGREKMEAAFSAAGTPEIPAVICYEGLVYRDHWREITALPWWYAFETDIDRQFEWMRDAAEATSQDWLHLPRCASRETRSHVRLEERSGTIYRIDDRAGEAEKIERPSVGGWAPAEGVHSVHRKSPPVTAAEIDAEIAVPRGFDPDAIVADGRADLAKMLMEECGRDKLPFVHVVSPQWCTYYLWGFDEMMTKVVSSPKLVEHACERYLALQIRAVEEAARLGAQAVWIEEWEV